MIAYLLKVTLCALLFLVVYSLFLEKERMHRFKRFYLIFSLILSFAIPLVTLEIPSGFLVQTAENVLVSVDEANEVELTSALELEQEVQYVPVSSLAKESLSVTFTQVLMGLYFVVALFLFIRFMRNVTHLIFSAKQGDVISHRGAKVVLIEQKMIPHSFMNYIFINKDEYTHRQIENEILTHELVHVKQKHSVDILFIEIFLILFWFNPVFYLYRSRMRLNHEFLADEGVVLGLEDVAHYQLILLDKVNEKRKLSLASNFNYLITKKRLIMMTKITSKKMLWLKIGGLLPLFIVAVLLFSTHVVAEQKNESTLVSPGIEQDVKTQKKGLTEEEMAEYKALIEKYSTVGEDGETPEISPEDKKKFTLYENKATDLQLKELPPMQTVRLVPPKANRSQKGLSAAEFEELKSLAEKLKREGSSLTQKEKDRFSSLEKNMSDAQRKEIPVKTTVRFVPPRRGEGKGVSQSLFDEYQNILKKYETPDGKYSSIGTKITDADRNRLKDLYKEMTYLQRDKLKIAVEEVLPPVPEKMPSDEEFQSWKDPKVYGVWIDGKKVDNSVLDNYSASDFSNYMVSRLYANAKKGKIYSFQLDLTTKKGYQDYLKNKKNEKPSIYYKEGKTMTKIG